LFIKHEATRTAAAAMLPSELREASVEL